MDNRLGLRRTHSEQGSVLKTRRPIFIERSLTQNARPLLKHLTEPRESRIHGLRPQARAP